MTTHCKCQSSLQMLLFFCKQWILKNFVETFPMYSHGVTASRFQFLFQYSTADLQHQQLQTKEIFALMCRIPNSNVESLWSLEPAHRAAKHPQYHTTNKYSSLNWSNTSIRIHACSSVSFSFHIHSKIKCLHLIFEPGLSKFYFKFRTFSKERSSKQDLLTLLQLNPMCLILQKQWIVNKHWIWIRFRYCHAVFPQCHKVIQQWHLNKIELNNKQLTKYSLNSEIERSN